MMSQLTIRPAAFEHLRPLAELWHAGWHEAHAALVPASLTRWRTLDRFEERLRLSMERLRVAVLDHEPLAFSLLDSDELNQFYVSQKTRGSVVAEELMSDALQRLRDGGHTRAWLHCAIGNLRAARFYERLGWQRAGVVGTALPTPDGELALEVWRYERDLRAW